MSSFTAEKQPRPQFRNLNFPLLLTYRLPLPGLVSILHRISGAALFLALPLLLWMFDLSLTSELSFEQLRAIATNFFFKLLLVFLIWGFFHHFVAGIRYLLLDLHIGIDLKAARASAIAVYAISVPLTLIAAFKVFGSVLMARPIGIGPKRVVVGAHYGLAGFIGQRITSVVLTLWVLLVGLSVLFGPLTYDRWAGLFAPLWMKIVTLIALLSLLYHAWIGVRNIWMDYIKPLWVRLSLEALTVLLLIAWAVWSVQILWRV